MFVIEHHRCHQWESIRINKDVMEVSSIVHAILKVRLQAWRSQYLSHSWSFWSIYRVGTCQFSSWQLLWWLEKMSGRNYRNWDEWTWKWSRDHLHVIFIDNRRNHYHGWHKNTTISEWVQRQLQMKTFSYQMWSHHNRWLGSASYHVHEHIPGVLIITTRNHESSCSQPCWTTFHRGTDDGTGKLRGFYLFCTGNISVVHETIRFKHHATL